MCHTKVDYDNNCFLMQTNAEISYDQRLGRGKWKMFSMSDLMLTYSFALMWSYAQQLCSQGCQDMLPVSFVVQNKFAISVLNIDTILLLGNENKTKKLVGNFLISKESKTT